MAEFARLQTNIALGGDEKDGTSDQRQQQFLEASHSIYLALFSFLLLPPRNAGSTQAHRFPVSWRISSDIAFPGGNLRKISKYDRNSRAPICHLSNHFSLLIHAPGTH